MNFSRSVKFHHEILRKSGTSRRTEDIHVFTSILGIGIRFFDLMIT